jgi:CysZ protein
MLTSIARSAAQLTDPRIRRVLLKSIALTIVVLAPILVGLWFALDRIHVSQHWLHWIIDVLGVLVVLVLAWVLFSVVASLVISLFLDEVADAVEARHYPGLAPARRQPLGELIREGLRFAGVSILLNVLALPIYALLLFIPPTNLVVFYGLNGYLLSREYFELAAFRRGTPPEARRLRQAHSGSMLLVGVLIAFLLTVPVVNLVAPVFATALMVHIHHELAAAPGAQRSR